MCPKPEVTLARRNILNLELLQYTVVYTVQSKDKQCVEGTFSIRSVLDCTQGSLQYPGVNVQYTEVRVSHENKGFYFEYMQRQKAQQAPR